MDLKARLARLPPPCAGTALAAPPPLAARELPSPAPRRHPPGARHGQAVIAQALELGPATLAQLALDPSLAGVDPARMLLLDTETTGLSGGAGTLPFLIGMAWFHQGELVVEQLLLPRPGEERPLLLRLGERLAASSLLVTYNGKTFDWPLLRTRFVLNRLPTPRPPPHLDLLHCARRVYARRLGAVRLGQLEEAVLGHRRVGDIPGGEVPAAYFEYLRSGEGAVLKPVLEHNEQDLLALAGLMATLAGTMEGRLEPGEDPRDWLSLANLCWRAEQPARAAFFADGALARTSEGALAVEALRLLSLLFRRAGQLEEARSALERALSLCEEPAVAAELHLCLAKLHEHRRRDFSRALGHAQQARGAEHSEQHERRLSRLGRRARKSSLSFW